MYCSKCGTQLEDGSKFCFTCGEIQQPEAPAPNQSDLTPQPDNPQPVEEYTQPAEEYTQPTEEYTQPAEVYTQPAEEYQQPSPAYTAPVPAYAPQGYTPEYAQQTKSRGGLWWKITIPVAVVVVAIVIGAYFLFFNNALKIQSINKAFVNLEKETAVRIDGSPLRAVGILRESVKDGKITIGVESWDRWGSEAGGSLSISSNVDERKFALAADFSVNGEELQAEAYIDRERIAVGSKLLDNNYYGFRYSTFRSDVKSFSDLIGIDDETLDAISDVVELIDETMNAKPGEGGDYDISTYTAIFTSFIKNITMTSKRTDIDSGENSVKCTQIDFLITEDALKKLISDLYEEIENDERIRKQLESQALDRMTNGEAGSTYDNMLRELRSVVRDIDRYYSGDITQSLFIGRGNRLLRTETRADVRYDDERIGVRVTLDFGATMEDRWLLNATVNEGSNRNTLKATWKYKERTSSIENSLTVEANGEDVFDVILLCSRKNGDFSLIAEDEWNKTEITGGFTSDDKGFHLELDNLYPDDDNYIAIEVDAEYGARIDSVDYINVDRWGETLIDNLEDVLNDLIGSGILRF